MDDLVIAGVVGPFAEAVRATAQPCTFLLIVPTLAAVVAARARWQVLVAALVAGIVGGWLLVDNRWIIDGVRLRLAAVVVIVMLAMLVVPSVGARVPTLATVWSSSVIVGAATLFATLWWRPCVGEELGAILNRSQDGLGGQLLPMAAYMLGAMVPAAAVVALRYAAEPPERMLAVSARVSTSVGILVAGSLAAGQHDEVVGTLTRWTLR